MAGFKLRLKRALFALGMLSLYSMQPAMAAVAAPKPWLELDCRATAVAALARHGLGIRCLNGDADGSKVVIARHGAALFDYEFGMNDRWLKTGATGVFILDVPRVPGESGLVPDATVVAYLPDAQSHPSEAARQQLILTEYKALYRQFLAFNAYKPCRQLDVYCEGLLLHVFKLLDDPLGCEALQGPLFRKITTAQLLAVAQSHDYTNKKRLNQCRESK